jgi:hypothetical protein
MMSPILRGHRRMRRSAVHLVLRMALPRSPRARGAVSRVLRVAVSGAEVAAFGRDLDADPCAGVALVGQGGQSGCGGGVERWQDVGAGGTDVVGRAGLDR